VAELLECCRDATGPERRHLRVMGSGQPLCGTVARQDGAGAGTFSGLLAWPSCAKCRSLAEGMGPHPYQADGVAASFDVTTRMAARARARIAGGEDGRG
jgi:hypothetical protein